MRKLLLILITLALACSDDSGPTVPIISDYMGTWEASYHIFDNNIFIKERLIIKENSNYQHIIVDGDKIIRYSGLGTYSISNNIFTFTPTSKDPIWWATVPGDWVLLVDEPFILVFKKSDNIFYVETEQGEEGLIFHMIEF